MWEVGYIVRHVRSYQNLPCLVAGDFNAIAPSESVKMETIPKWLKWILYLQGNRVYHFSIAKLLAVGFTDCFRNLNADEGFTLPPPNPNSRLDYIFVNATMKPYLKQCWVVREPESVNRASDHYPVMAEFSFTG
jgi:exonuclease III